MSESLKLLDKALELGHRELESLNAGDVHVTHDLARQRGELVAEAWKHNQEMDVELLMDKLKQLKVLQGQLTVEAKRLHETLKNDLAKAKQENKRISGYHNTVKAKPLYSRFVSKQG